MRHVITINNKYTYRPIYFKIISIVMGVRHTVTQPYHRMVASINPRRPPSISPMNADFSLEKNRQSIRQMYSDGDAWLSPPQGIVTHTMTDAGWRRVISTPPYVFSRYHEFVMASTLVSYKTIMDGYGSCQQRFQRKWNTFPDIFWSPPPSLSPRGVIA